MAFGGRGRWPSRRALVFVHTLLDTTAICALLYCSGGVASGLGILLVIPVGAMSLLAEGRASLGVAALAALGLLTQQILAVIWGNAQAYDYSLAGMLGAVVFLVALMAWPVSNRLRESEALVRRQELDLANLAQLSQYIVQRLRESILVVDPSDRIRLINESAARMLGDNVAVPGALLGEVAPRLLYLLSTWRKDESLILRGGAGTLVADDGARVIRPHFAPLGSSEPSPIIVFLEDTGDLAAKVQQTKLAALGRLSASIAHEIRNPVGAMSHAAQLLAESPALSAADRRLTEIMQDNSTRVSGIIDNILQLSRREAPRPEKLMLEPGRGAFAMSSATPCSCHGSASSSIRPPKTWSCASTAASCTRSSGTCARTASRTRCRTPARRRSNCVTAAWRASAGRFCRSPIAAPALRWPMRNGYSSRSSRAPPTAPGLACFWRANSGRPMAPPCCMRRARAGVASSASCLPTRAGGARSKP